MFVFALHLITIGIVFFDSKKKKNCKYFFVVLHTNNFYRQYLNKQNIMHGEGEKTEEKLN